MLVPAFALFILPARVSASPSILFLSTQLTPPPEATMMRQTILGDFTPVVDFQPFDRAVYTRKVLELAAHPGVEAVIGGVQEDFLTLYRAGALANVEDIGGELSDRAFLPRFAGRGVFGDDGAFFVPWMQATYLMAANKRALKYLPTGADLRRLTYDELLQWAAAIHQATGKGKLGFPTGPKGLMPRFLQGYLYPSFTGSMTRDFRSPAATDMWMYFRDLWQHVAPSSLIINRMDEALLNGEVRVAWDHSARLLQAFKERPDEFVAFPAPIGPKGRGIISVLTGLGLPKGSPRAPALQLIEYLTRPRVQARTMESVGFLPVVRITDEEKLPKGLKALLQAAVDQLDAPEAILSSVPPLGGDAGRSFDLVYAVAFSRIVLRGRDIASVLARQEEKLLQLNAPDSMSPSELRGH